MATEMNILENAIVQEPKEVLLSDPFARVTAILEELKNRGVKIDILDKLATAFLPPENPRIIRHVTPDRPEYIRNVYE